MSIILVYNVFVRKRAHKLPPPIVGKESQKEEKVLNSPTVERMKIVSFPVPSLPVGQGLDSMVLSVSFLLRSTGGKTLKTKGVICLLHRQQEKGIKRGHSPKVSLRRKKSP